MAQFLSHDSLDEFIGATKVLKDEGGSTVRVLLNGKMLRRVAQL